MIITNSNITINVKDLERSISFYESIGFQLKAKWGNHFAQLTAPGIEIGLHPVENLNDSLMGKGISLGFTTQNFEATKNELNDLGIQFTERTEQGGEFIHFHDPNGTPLYFIKTK